MSIYYLILILSQEFFTEKIKKNLRYPLYHKAYLQLSCDQQLARRGIHPNPHLQRAWQKYGAENFSIEITEQTSVDDLLTREQVYLDKSKHDPLCYNASFIAGRIEHTDVVREKISYSQRRRLSDKTKHHMFGKHHSLETRQKISKTLTGRAIPLEVRKVVSAGCRRFNEQNPGYRKGKISRTKNPRYNHTIFQFRNLKTGEIVTDTKYNFKQRFHLDMSDLCRRFVKKSHGWELIST